MSEHILSLLPLTEQEHAELLTIRPDAEFEFARRSTVTAEQLARATVILGAPKPADLVHAVRLRWLQSQWAGVDEYLAPGVLPERVAVSGSTGAYDQTVSEHMLTCLLALLRKIPQYRDCQRERQWKDLGEMRSIRGANVLVVGAGNIGAAFARLCKALGAHTVGLKRTVGAPIDGFDELDTMDRLDDRLPEADVVALVVPHAPETVGLMDARRLKLMKPDAVLINAGRGSVIVDRDLCDVMGAGHLWGAALDVFVPEPLPADSPLWGVPNLLITPHVAGGFRLASSRTKVVAICFENLRRVARGQKPTGLLRPGDLFRDFC